MRGLIRLTGADFKVIQVGADFLAQLDQVGLQLFVFGLADSLGYGRGERSFFLNGETDSSSEVACARK